MSKFAKLFYFEEIGQVLVKLDDGDKGAEVRVYFQPKNLGVCSMAFTFKPDSEGGEWDKAEKAFDLIDEDKAKDIVLEALNTIPVALSE